MNKSSKIFDIGNLFLIESNGNSLKKFTYLYLENINQLLFHLNNMQKFILRMLVFINV